MQESTQNLLRLVHDAAFETALKGQFDEDRETVESILQSALNILEGKALLAQTGLAVSVGVATTKYVAKVASDLDKPDGLVVVPPGEERGFLAGLPLSRLWGVGPSTRATLERAGLRSIQDVQSRSRGQLLEGFGDKLGEHLYTLANGLDTRPVVSERAAKSIGHEMTFAEDLREVDDVKGILLQLAEMVGRRLRRAGNRSTPSLARRPTPSIRRSPRAAARAAAQPRSP